LANKTKSYGKRRLELIRGLRAIETQAKTLANAVESTEEYVPEHCQFVATLLLSGMIVGNRESHHGASAIHAYMAGDDGVEEITAHDHVKQWGRLLGD